MIYECTIAVNDKESIYLVDADSYGLAEERMHNYGYVHISGEFSIKQIAEVSSTRSIANVDKVISVDNRSQRRIGFSGYDDIGRVESRDAVASPQMSNIVIHFD